MSYYGFDNSYMLDMIALHKGAFVGTAVIDPAGDAPDKLMGELAKKRVRAFRIYPGLESGTKPNAGAGKGWLRPDGYDKMFAAGAKNNQAISCLIDPDALPEVDRMCTKYPDTPVIIDHLCRIGVDGTIRDKDVDALCAHGQAQARHGQGRRVLRPGQEVPPYTDLGPMIEKVVKAFGAESLHVGERLSVSGGQITSISG